MRFGLICEASDIEHGLTKPNYPWTNAQLDRMNRTIEDATVTRYHSETHDQRRSHLSDILDANNLERRLKRLSGLAPYQYICKTRTSEPERSTIHPIHQMQALNSQFQATYLPYSKHQSGWLDIRPFH